MKLIVIRRENIISLELTACGIYVIGDFIFCEVPMSKQHDMSMVVILGVYALQLSGNLKTNKKGCARHLNTYPKNYVSWCPKRVCVTCEGLESQIMNQVTKLWKNISLLLSI